MAHLSARGNLVKEEKVRRALFAAAAAAALTLPGAAMADDYRGTHHDYSTKIVIYNDVVSPVKGVRVGHHYEFSLEAFGSDTSFAFMCVKVSTRGTWNCRDTIAAGTLEADLYQNGLGTDFLVTPKMVLGGVVTIRALDIDRTPLVTRVVPVVR